MAETINREVFDHLVKLAALELDEQEAEYLRRELNSQLKAIDELAAITVDEGIEIGSHGVPFPAEISPIPREDKLSPFPNPEEIVAQAPKSKDGYFLVPDIPQEELD